MPAGGSVRWMHDLNPVQPEYEAAVVGAGFSGIGAAIKLDEGGVKDFVVIEDGDGVGGAWHWNTYPGIAVDIPSFSYQFSFDTRPDWSRVYAPGAELKAYAEDLVDKYGLRSRLRLNTRIVGATFDDDGHFWHLHTRDGEEITARFVVGATGVLTQPKPPEIPGVDSFAGLTMHTSRWDHSQDLTGKRVAIIGTGASAVQVIPSIAPVVGHLTVFQRTPIWCMPKLDREMSPRTKWILKNVPGAKLAARLLSQFFVELTFPLPAQFGGKFPAFGKRGEKVGLQHLATQVHDPVVREKLTPKYGLGCKRPGFSNDYFPAFNRENVFLETDPISEITPTSVKTTTGTEHEIDVLILATGFKVFEAGNVPPFPTRGVDGLDLEQWFDENRFQAYQGVSVPGFPNSFSILGPYGFNGASYFVLIETQMTHIMRCLKHARRTGATKIEVTREANDRYFEEMLSRRKNQIFFQGTCATANSYYFDKNGDAPFRASLSLETMWRARTFDLGDYRFEKLPARVRSAA